MGFPWMPSSSELPPATHQPTAPQHTISMKLAAKHPDSTEIGRCDHPTRRFRTGKTGGVLRRGDGTSTAVQGTGGVVRSDKRTGRGREAKYTVICLPCHLSAGLGLHTLATLDPCLVHCARRASHQSSRAKLEQSHQGAPARDRVPGPCSCSLSARHGGWIRDTGSRGDVAEAEPFLVTHHFFQPLSGISAT